VLKCSNVVGTTTSHRFALIASNEAARSATSVLPHNRVAQTRRIHRPMPEPRSSPARDRHRLLVSVSSGGEAGARILVNDVRQSEDWALRAAGARAIFVSSGPFSRMRFLGALAGLPADAAELSSWTLVSSEPF